MDKKLIQSNPEPRNLHSYQLLKKCDFMFAISIRSFQRGTVGQRPAKLPTVKVGGF